MLLESLKEKLGIGRAAHGPQLMHPHSLLKGHQRRGLFRTTRERIEDAILEASKGSRFYMDGAFYNDLREPFMAADAATVTLAATNKALYSTSDFPVLGGNYFARPGKKLRGRGWGKITTGATPGNGTFALFYGSGADAAGTSIQVSAAQTLLANQTNLSFDFEWEVRCVTKGAAGTLEAWMKLYFNTAVIAAGTVQCPASALVPSGAVDLTAANIISMQALRSGSTAETMTIQDLDVIAMN